MRDVPGRVIIIEMRVNEGSGDCSDSGKFKSATEMMEVMNVVMASARKKRNLFGKR